MFLWTRRMQFWQPFQKIFGKRLENFHSMSENDSEIVISTKKNIWLRNLPLITYNAVFTIPLTIFFPRAECFSLIAQKSWKSGFFKNALSIFFENAPKFFCIRGLHFYSLVKNFLPEGRNLFVRYPKVKKYCTFFSRIFLLKRFVFSVTTDFRNACRKPCPGSRNFLPKGAKT